MLFHFVIFCEVFENLPSVVPGPSDWSLSTSGQLCLRLEQITKRFVEQQLIEH